MEDYRKYLDPKTLNKIAGLDLKARLIVEGYISGLHKSPYHGFSVEFAEHREYSPGDDIRHVDWKVFRSPYGPLTWTQRASTSARDSYLRSNGWNWPCWMRANKRLRSLPRPCQIGLA